MFLLTIIEINRKYSNEYKNILNGNTNLTNNNLQFILIGRNWLLAYSYRKGELNMKKPNSTNQNVQFASKDSVLKAIKSCSSRYGTALANLAK